MYTIYKSLPQRARAESSFVQFRDTLMSGLRDPERSRGSRKGQVVPDPNDPTKTIRRARHESSRTSKAPQEHPTIVRPRSISKKLTLNPQDTTGQFQISSLE